MSLQVRLSSQLMQVSTPWVDSTHLEYGTPLPTAPVTCQSFDILYDVQSSINDTALYSSGSGSKISGCKILVGCFSSVFFGFFLTNLCWFLLCNYLWREMQKGISPPLKMHVELALALTPAACISCM